MERDFKDAIKRAEEVRKQKRAKMIFILVGLLIMVVLGIIGINLFAQTEPKQPQYPRPNIEDVVKAPTQPKYEEELNKLKAEETPETTEMEEEKKMEEKPEPKVNVAEKVEEKKEGDTNITGEKVEILYESELTQKKQTVETETTATATKTESTTTQQTTATTTKTEEKKVEKKQTAEKPKTTVKTEKTTKPPKKTIKKAEKTNKVIVILREHLPSGYYIQLGAFSDKTKAIRFASKVNTDKLYVVKEGVLYKVLVGKFSTRKEAYRTLRKLNVKGFVRKL
ncbi:MAG: hypothetical protein GXO45_04085 [Aquificae bacterium]|nr:hypothetical protein [Aquificota bacterium]